MNSAHPFENPTALSNFVELLAILLIPAAAPIAFGRLVGKPRHGMAIFAAMMTLFVSVLVVGTVAEFSSNSTLGGLPFLEGKEWRFGTGASVLWSIATTASSNGSVNAMLSSHSPLVGMMALLNIVLGEVVFGGVGSGLYGMVLFAILTVFIAGLMVGRTPEYLSLTLQMVGMALAP